MFMATFTTAFTTTALLQMNSYAASSDTILSEMELRGDVCSFAQEGINECLEKKLQESEIALQQAEKKMRKSFAEWDEDSVYRRIASERFYFSMQAFVLYREAQCEFAASLGGGAIGHALDTRRLACLTELNNRRTAQLRYGPWNELLE
jgi:uncharacterized protein YecT (DUF1311 family)